MKKDAFSSTPPVLEKPKSALERLWKKNSPAEAEKPALPVSPDIPRSRKFERIFRYLDENGDGNISPTELLSSMKMVGVELSVEEAEAVVQLTDSDGDGLLGFEDFVKLIEVDGEEEKRTDLREAFGMYEMEGSGCITPKSLKRMLSRLGESKTMEECTAMIRQFDLNGDGVLTFDEFTVMML
ncbi:putative calcium-binding protein CML23 [Magnolia sinica]|uniref:putative calcium-binding protein CML23 n=1 Tax=Magnolia sinica TaxID=86752 RepID=UPI00265895B2|nr:putative calcium-binding protein CML23 [Magnolia sinica]